MEYTFEKVEFDEKSLVDASKILSKSFPDSNKFTSDYLRWQYKDNPIGYVIGYNAFHGDVLAAHYVTLPIKMILFGETKKGLLSLNTATHPNHRGKGLFTKLAEKTFDYGRELGYEFVIGVANANSTHGFLNKLGFYLISPLNIRFGFTKNIRIDKKFNCYRYWDDELIEWRLNCPYNKYKLRNNLITAPHGSIGIKGIVGKVDTKLEIKNNIGFRPVNLYVGLGAKLPKGRFFKIPSFVKHSPFNLIFRDLVGNIPEIKKEDILFQLLDYDVI